METQPHIRSISNIQTILLPDDIGRIEGYDGSHASTMKRQNREQQIKMLSLTYDANPLSMIKKTRETVDPTQSRKYALGSNSDSGSEIRLPFRTYMLVKSSDTQLPIMPRSGFNKQRMVWMMRDNDGEQKSTDLTLGEKEVDRQETVACQGITKDSCNENTEGDL